jgi:hypothetical protein
MNHSIRSVDLPTGVTLQYVEQGDPAGVPAVLLHGASDSGGRTNSSCRTCRSGSARSP